MAVLRTCLRACAPALLAGLSPGPADATTASRWRWVRVEPVDARAAGDAWRVQQGASEVTIAEDGRFSTMLDYVSGNLSQHYRLVGTVDGDAATARETLAGSDAQPLRYSGTFSRDDGCVHLVAGRFAILLCKDTGERA